MTASQATSQAFKGFSKFMVENHAPKYILVGIITLKLVSIYDKCKTIVAVN